MKTLKLIAVIGLTALAVHAQSFIAAGASCDGSTCTPFGTYGYSIGGGVYSLTTADVSVVSRKPLTFTHSVRTGFGYDLTSIAPQYSLNGRLKLIGLSDVGTGASATSIGSAFSGGGIGAFDLGPKMKNLWLFGGGRVVKTIQTGTGIIFQFGVAHAF